MDNRPSLASLMGKQDGYLSKFAGPSSWLGKAYNAVRSHPLVTDTLRHDVLPMVGGAFGFTGAQALWDKAVDNKPLPSAGEYASNALSQVPLLLGAGAAWRGAGNISNKLEYALSKSKAVHGKPASLYDAIFHGQFTKPVQAMIPGTEKKFMASQLQPRRNATGTLLPRPAYGSAERPTHSTMNAGEPGAKSKYIKSLLGTGAKWGAGLGMATSLDNPEDANKLMAGGAVGYGLGHLLGAKAPGLYGVGGMALGSLLSSNPERVLKGGARGAVMGGPLHAAMWGPHWAGAEKAFDPYTVKGQVATAFRMQPEFGIGMKEVEKNTEESRQNNIKAKIEQIRLENPELYQKILQFQNTQQAG